MVASIIISDFSDIQSQELEVYCQKSHGESVV